MPRIKTNVSSLLASLLLVLGLGGCSYFEPPGEPLPEISDYDFDYVVGPRDTLNIFVWRNPELSTTAEVRPDGKITVPLVEDLVVTGKTATELAREIEGVLSRYVRDPLVTVMVSGFNGVASEQIRVLGEATNPATLPYEADMTLLDLMIAVGGLTEFADGNRAKLIRNVDGEQRSMRVRLDDLIKDADLSANVKLAPGDVLIVPEAWF